MFNTKKTISLDEEALILDGRRLPTHNSPKYFAAVDIIEAAQNREWLSTATRQINLDNRRINPIDAGGQIFYSGFSFGCEGSW